MITIVIKGSEKEARLAANSRGIGFSTFCEDGGKVIGKCLASNLQRIEMWWHDDRNVVKPHPPGTLPVS